MSVVELFALLVGFAGLWQVREWLLKELRRCERRGRRRAKVGALAVAAVGWLVAHVTGLDAVVGALAVLAAMDVVLVVACKVLPRVEEEGEKR